MVYGTYRRKRTAVKSKRSWPPKRKTFNRRVKSTLMAVAETKKHYSEHVETAVDALSSGHSANLASLAQGAGVGQRVGHKVKCVGFAINWALHNNTGNPMLFRIMIVRPRRHDASNTSLLENNTGDAAVGSAGLRLLLSQPNREHFEILRDFTLKLGYGNSNGPQVRNGRVYIPYKRSMSWSSNATGEPDYNNVRLYAFCDQANNDTTGTQTVEFSYISCMYFKDI